MLSSWTKSKIRNVLKIKAAASQGLRVIAFDKWQKEIDDALTNLPETDILSHELFRAMMELSPRDKQKLLLVTERGEPVAVAGLRNRWGNWEPVAQWIIPGVMFPVKNDYIFRVLPALGLELNVAWWRWGVPPPDSEYIVNSQLEPTYGAHLTDDFESYWRKKDNFKGVLRQCRKRCQEFEFKVNLPGVFESILNNWAIKWCPEEFLERPDLAERLLVSQYLQKKGLYYTLSLHDRDILLAGLTFIKHGDVAVSHINYRNPDFDWHGVMNRLWDLSFYWAKEFGFERIDLGGSFEYKKNWAPQNGNKWTFTIFPENIVLEKTFQRFLRR